MKSANAGSRMTWTSSDKAVLKVNRYGVIIGLKSGEATVTVSTANGLSAKIKVKVR